MAKKFQSGIGIIRFLSKYASRDILDQMYKLFVRPHLDYGDIIYYDQSMPLSRKLESTQYQAALAVSARSSNKNLFDNIPIQTRLRVHFSELNEHRFHHKFFFERPLCSCKEGIEYTVHFFLHCPLYLDHRIDLLGEVSDIIKNDVTQLPDDHLCDLLLFAVQILMK